jgi:UDP-glucuronate 4-epimerase
LPPHWDKAAGPGAQAPMRLCNIGNQQPVELLHLVRTIESCLGRSANVHLMPMQPGDVYQTQARVEKLKAVTGYSPRVPIEDGIRRFVDWYHDEYLPLGLADSLPFPLPPRAQGVHQDVPAVVREG